MSINLQAFRQSLVFMGEGMLGIFAVMLVIIGVIYALAHWTAGHEKSFLVAFLSARSALKKADFQKD